MLIVEVNSIDAQATEGALDGLLDVLRPGVQATPPGLALGGGSPTELGRDDDLGTERSQRFTHEFFVRVRTVNFGRIEEDHAALYRRAQQRDHFLTVRDRAVGPAHAHAAETEGGDF